MAGDVAADIGGRHAGFGAQRRDDRAVDVGLADRVRAMEKSGSACSLVLRSSRGGWAGRRACQASMARPMIGSTGLVNVVPVLLTSMSSRQTASAARISRESPGMGSPSCCQRMQSARSREISSLRRPENSQVKVSARMSSIGLAHGESESLSCQTVDPGHLRARWRRPWPPGRRPPGRDCGAAGCWARWISSPAGPPRPRPGGAKGGRPRPGPNPAVSGAAGWQQPEQRLAKDALGGPRLADQAEYLAAAYLQADPVHRPDGQAGPPERDGQVLDLGDRLHGARLGRRVSRVVTSASSAGGRLVPGSRACHR